MRDYNNMENLIKHLLGTRENRDKTKHIYLEQVLGVDGYSTAMYLILQSCFISQRRCFYRIQIYLRDIT